MSKKKRRSSIQTIQRISYEEYGISKNRLLELQDGCRTGMCPSEMMSNACNGFEFVGPWIILSVTKNRSYDSLEFDLKLGRIPCGRSNFYSYRRRFYYNLDCLLRAELENAPSERKG